MSSGKPSGRVIRYSCANGIKGTFTPAMRPISGANMPPALILQWAVEVTRVHHHRGQAERASWLADQAGGVKRGAASDARALDQHEVLPAEAREPVKDGRAADTTTDDDGACVLPQTIA